jgi:hypothetical protein
MMPALVFSAAVRDLALEIAWSLWAELGLSGWTRHHAESAVDLEPLIIATPRLGRMGRQAPRRGIRLVRPEQPVRLCREASKPAEHG